MNETEEQKRDAALKAARKTVTEADRTIREIEAADTVNGSVSLPTAQADEFARYLLAFRDELTDRITKAEGSKDAFPAKVVETRQSELEDALAFVESAILAPRRHNQDRQALEAADWMCIEIWKQFQDLSTSEEVPFGPLTAIDSRRSPAVWDSKTALPMPTLFSHQPVLISRGKTEKADERKLGYFPLICMPVPLTRQPEYLPLLAHEVGHAIDAQHGLMEKILADLTEHNWFDYWKAWMREIIADYVGILASGEAFVLAFTNYVRFMSTSNAITTSSAYPGQVLREAFLADTLTFLGLADHKASQPGSAYKPGDTETALRRSFTTDVLPLLNQHFLTDPKTWLLEEQSLRKVATRFAQSLSEEKPNNADLTRVVEKRRFSQLPSVVALACFRNASAADSLKGFQQLHTIFSTGNRKPAWVQSDSSWRFTIDTLPSLRATILHSDGRTKVPPEDLLVHYDTIAFVAATNGQLAERLKAARLQRRTPWKRLEFYFLSDAGLSKVERDTNPPLSRDALTAELIREGVQARGDLATLLADKNISGSWSFGVFDGPLVFGAWFDWTEHGGRIHVSPQLLGTDLRQCPSQDVVWTEAEQPPVYQKYVRHLDRLRSSATPLP